jgi:hypothetical protein
MAVAFVAVAGKKPLLGCMNVIREGLVVVDSFAGLCVPAKVVDIFASVDSTG